MAGSGLRQLELLLEAPASAVVGLPIVATVRVVNRGPESRTVSSRLNLIEGDLRLHVTRPDGRAVTISGAGGQPDSELRQVTLQPGHEVRSGINLQADDPGTFGEPGVYELASEYLPSPAGEWLSSNRARIQVGRGTRAQREAAALLAREGAGTALALGRAGADATLRDFAGRYGETDEGRLVRLLLAGDPATGDIGDELERIGAGRKPEAVALWISALSTPFSGAGPRLAAELETALGKGDAASAASRDRAARIARGLPFPSR